MKLIPHKSYSLNNEPWLNNHPQSWDLQFAKRIFRQRRTPSSVGDEQLTASQKYGVIPQKLFMEMEGHKVALAIKGTEAFKRVNKGDYLISLRSFQGGIEYCHYTGCVSPAYVCLEAIKDINNKFYSYLFKCNDFVYRLQTLTDGLRDGKMISYEDFSKIKLPTPSLVEQTKIATFLDRETAKLDTLISKQKHLIELLQEKRQAIISHAITKGLNPDAKMKDSGVEWLGMVPEHWCISKNKHYFNFSKGLSITKDDLSEIGVPCLNYGEIHSKFGFEFNPDVNLLRCVSDDYIKNYSGCLLEYGDFAFADTSEDYEGSGNFTYLTGNKPVFAGYHTVIARMKIKLNPRFFAYFFQSNAHRNQIRTSVSGVKVFSVTQNILKNTFISTPCISEQNDIVLYLNNQTSKIDTLIEKAKLSIELVKEHRTSLISAAVTGKIDVRECV